MTIILSQFFKIDVLWLTIILVISSEWFWRLFEISFSVLTSTADNEFVEIARIKDGKIQSDARPTQ